MNKNPLKPFLDYINSLHLYSRRQIADDLGSEVKYGDGTCGGKEILKKAKEEYELALAEKPIDDSFGELYIFQEQGEEGAMMTQEEVDHEVSTADFLIEKTNRNFEEFIGKDYLVDISPKSIHIIFPDMTFLVNLKLIIDTSWEDIREILQEHNILEKDIAFLSGNIGVSLDMLRKKIKNQTITENELNELRKKLYGLAEITFSIIESKNKSL